MHLFDFTSSLHSALCPTNVAGELTEPVSETMMLWQSGLSVHHDPQVSVSLDGRKPYIQGLYT